MKNINNGMNKNKGIILFVVVLMSFIQCVDMSIVNIALPVMAKKLAISMATVELVVVSYITVICSVILVFGRLGDVKGKTKIFQFGVVIFTIASFLCGISTSFTSLVIFRILQGIGAAASMANNQGIITEVFTQNDRGKALGILASAVALGTMIGPPLGGFILSALNWQCIFFVNIPIGIVAFALGLKVLPKGISNNEKIDIKGAILFFITVISLFSSLIGAQTLGYSNPLIIVSFIVALISFLTFITLERRVEVPLLDLEIFKNNIFSISLFCAFVSFVCISASGIIIPFYLQNTLKIDSAKAGLIMMISPLIITMVSPFSGSLSDKIGAKFLTFLGLIFTSIGFALMSFLDISTPIVGMILFLAIMAIGNGLFQPSNNSLIMSSAPRNKLGIAGSVNSLVRNLGQIFGVTLATTVLYNFMSYKIGYRVINYIENRDDVFIFGMRYIYIMLAIICGIGAIITAFRLYSNKLNLIKA